MWKHTREIASNASLSLKSPYFSCLLERLNYILQKIPKGPESALLLTWVSLLDQDLLQQQKQNVSRRLD